MKCRKDCGACCIAPSISSPIPGMPNGKAAGVRCLHLTPDLRCAIFDRAERPKVCNDFVPELDICGNSRMDAIRILSSLEKDRD